jgi:hypothetical protein
MEKLKGRDHLAVTVTVNKRFVCVRTGLNYEFPVDVDHMMASFLVTATV